MPDEAPSTRGSLQFQITPGGDLANSAVNVRLLVAALGRSNADPRRRPRPRRPRRLRSRRLAQLVPPARRRRRVPRNRWPHPVAGGLACADPRRVLRQRNLPRLGQAAQRAARLGRGPLTRRAVHPARLRGGEFDRPRLRAHRLRCAGPVQPLAAAGFRSAGDLAARRGQGLGALVYAARSAAAQPRRACPR